MTVTSGSLSVESATPFSLSVDLQATGAAKERTELAAYRWTATPASAGDKPPLVIVHGFAEHARRHAELATVAAAAGHPVYALDLPGHGESPGRRAVVSDYRAPLAAVRTVVELAAGEAGGGKPVLYGHSMGGAIALAFALDHPEALSGLILSSPYLIDAVDYPAFVHGLVALIAKVMPGLPVTKVSPDQISRDSAEVARYRNDPLVQTSGVPAISANTLTRMGAELRQRASRLAVRTLVLHGEADGIAGVAGSRSLHSAAPKGLVELVTLPGAQHELIHEDSSSGVPQRATEAVLDFLATTSRVTAAVP